MESDLCRLRDQISIDPRPALRQQFRRIPVLICLVEVRSQQNPRCRSHRGFAEETTRIQGRKPAGSIRRTWFPRAVNSRP